LLGFLDKLKGSISGLKGTTLYYPGCLTRHALPFVMVKYKALLSDLGVDFKIIDEINCCGAPLLNAGYALDFAEIKEKNIRLMKKHNVTRIITNCPHCYDMLKNQYFLPAEHISQTLEAHKHKLAHRGHEEIAYHDPCLLARKNNVIKEPRLLLKQIGFRIIEPARSREKTFCCGAGGGLKQNSPALANQIAKERLNHLGAKKIIVSCPYCLLHLSENAGNKKIIELSQVLVED
jgi:Fe-S oxidoreductase